MAIELPAAQKVYTTKYDNFKGVDFTNDATNVWHRRSPSAVNMLPDASGRPFKRHGWDILITQEQLCTYLEEPSCTIQKCSWFEIAGIDHLAIFTDKGLIFWNGNFVCKNKEYDCYSSYERCFFFEGDGLSAFYIYGSFRVWRYEWTGDESFALVEVTDKLYVPTVMVGASSETVGTMVEGYNLLSNSAKYEYNDVTLFTYWCSDGISIVVPDSFKTGKTADAEEMYKWTRESGSWVTKSGGVAWSDSGITVSGDVEDGMEVYVLYIYGILLPNNVTQNQIAVSKVEASTSTQFDTDVPILAEQQKASISASNCVLYTDTTSGRKSRRSWIHFGKQWTQVVDGEDFIRVTVPSASVDITPYSNITQSGAAALIIGGGA